jgi:hypothetical protein
MYGKPKIRLGYEAKATLKMILLFLLIFIILPALIWGSIFLLYPEPLTQLLWLILIVGYYFFAIFLCYVLFPQVYGMIRRVFFGIGSDEHERQLAEGALGSDPRGRDATYLDANRIMAQRGRGPVADSGLVDAAAGAPGNASTDTPPPRPPERKFSDNTRFCPSCGEPAKPGEKQCGKCATKL